MAINTKTLELIKSLRGEAYKLANFHNLFATKYASDSSCDKKGFGFGKDNRFSAFKLTTSFDSWSGYYGNSNCGSILHVCDVEPYIIKAMNIHQKELFATAARMMREEAAGLTEAATAELEALQEMLTVAQSDISQEEQSAA